MRLWQCRALGLLSRRSAWRRARPASRRWRAGGPRPYSWQHGLRWVVQGHVVQPEPQAESHPGCVVLAAEAGTIRHDVRDVADLGSKVGRHGAAPAVGVGVHLVLELHSPIRKQPEADGIRSLLLSKEARWHDAALQRATEARVRAGCGLGLPAAGVPVPLLDVRVPTTKCIRNAFNADRMSS